MKFRPTYLLASILILLIGRSSTTVIKPAVGDVAPEIKMISNTGETLTLSNLRGKLVLVDFWASWCRTCRIENNGIRLAHSKYKNYIFKNGKGFEVFSVSLDKDAEVWNKAILNDKLTWKYHVSDFKKWDSPVVEAYNFKYLPFNVLIDKDGVILAKNLFGHKLEEELAKYSAN